MTEPAELPKNPITREQIESWMNVYRGAEESKPKKYFDRSFNLGHLLTIAAMVMTILGVSFQLNTKFSDLERGMIAAEERAKKYVPMIETAAALNGIQEDRIQNLAIGLQEVRKSNNDLMIVMGNVRESLARVETRLQTGQVR